MASQLSQALEQMEVTNEPHDSRGLEPLKAVAGGQRMQQLGGFSCRPVPLPTLPRGCTKWDGMQGTWGCRTCWDTVWSFWWLPQPCRESLLQDPSSHGVKNSSWERWGKEIHGDLDAFCFTSGLHEATEATRELTAV